VLTEGTTLVQSSVYDAALDVFSKDLTPAALEAVRNKVQPSSNTIGLLLRMPRNVPGRASELNTHDFCDEERRQLYVTVVSAPQVVSGTAFFDWAGKRTPNGLCDLDFDATGFGNATVSGG
jgi:hypothetical protein